MSNHGLEDFYIYVPDAETCDAMIYNGDETAICELEPDHEGRHQDGGVLWSTEDGR